jgi:hypothetical protein
MLPVETFRATLEKLVLILDQQGIRFHLTGGFSTIAYGEPRMTQDVDIVVEPRKLSVNLSSFLTAVDAAGFLVDVEAARRAVAEGGMFQLLDLAESLKIDLYPREMIAGELDRSAQAEVFAGFSLPIVSRSDAALSKLMWISKGSHKSRGDLRNILKRASVSEREFVEQNAASLGLAPLLAAVLAESDVIGP